MAPRNAHSLRTAPEYLRFQDGGGLSKEAVMAAIARQRAQSAQAPQAPQTPAQAPAAAPQDRGIGGLAADFLRNPGAILRDREQRAGIRFQDGGVVPGTGRGDKIPAKYEPGEFVVSNDMIDDNPGLREQLSGLRAETLAARGKTVEEADAGALSGGRRPSLRAADGFDPFGRMARDLTGQNPLPPRSPVGNMADDLSRNARATVPEGPAVRPTAPLPPEAAAAYDASPEGRATRVQALKDTRGYFQGEPRAAAPSAAAANTAAAAPTAPAAAPAASPAGPSTLRRAASAVGNGILYGGAALGGALAAKGLSDVGAPKGTAAVPGERQAGDSANSMQIPIGGNSPAPDAQPYNFWTGSEAGRNLGNAANAIAPLGGLAMAARVPGAATKAFGLADAAVTGLAVGVRDERDSAARAAPTTGADKRVRPEDTFAGRPESARSPVGDTIVFGAGSVAPPGYTNNVTRNGNEYSGTNVRGDITINGFAPGAGLDRGNVVSPQNMAAADALAQRDSLRSMGAAASQQQQAPMPPSIASPRPLTTHELRNLEVSAKSIMNTEKWGGKGADKNPDVIAYQNAMNAHIAQRNGMDPGTIARTQAQANMYGSQANADASRYASDNSLRGDMFKTAATERSTRAAAAAAAEKYRVERGDKAADRRDKATERLDKVFASYAAGKDGKTDERQLADLRNNAQAFLGSAIEAARKRGDMATVEQLNTQGLAALADDPELMRRYVASNKADRIARNSWGGTYNATDNPGGRQITKVEDGKVHFSDGTTAPRAKIEYANDGVLPHRFADWDPFASRTTEFDALDPRGALRKVNP